MTFTLIDAIRTVRAVKPTGRGALCLGRLRVLEMCGELMDRYGYEPAGPR